jgi:hypothetical protein
LVADNCEFVDFTEAATISGDAAAVGGAFKSLSAVLAGIGFEDASITEAAATL